MTSAFLYIVKCLPSLEGLLLRLQQAASLFVGEVKCDVFDGVGSSVCWDAMN